MRITFTNPTALQAADTDHRELAGVALPYGEQGFTDRGPIVVDAGAIRIPENLRRVKLFTEHGRNQPVGFTLSADDGPDQLAMSFHVARTPAGDQALLEAAEGVRDALSVELDNITVSEAGHLTAGDLTAVALTSVPAFASARLTAALSDEAQAEVNDLAQQIVDATAPAAEEEPPPEEAPPTTEQERPMTETAAAPAAALNATLSPTTRRDPTASRRLFASQVAEAMRGARDAGQVNAALADITPTSAATDDLFPRPAWIGELWSPEAPQRALVAAIGTQNMTAMKMQGWKWVTKPEVAPYAGNKAEIPTSPAVVGPAEADGYRIAGGWDLDRIYVDFNTGFVEAFLRAATIDYRRKSQTYFIDGHAAVVGPPAVPAVDGIVDDATDLGAAADLAAALSTVVGFLAGNGANVSFLGMAADVFADFLALDAASVPWWLQQQGSVNLNGNGSADVAGVTVAVDPGLPNGTVLGGDRAAISLWETGPINVQAVNLPNGGVDLALFGYQAQMVHDPDGLAFATVTAGP